MCVSNLVTFLYTSSYSCFFETHTQQHHGETSKGKAIFFPFSASVFVLVLTPLIRINARGLPAKVDAFKKII